MEKKPRIATSETQFFVRLEFPAAHLIKPAKLAEVSIDACQKSSVPIKAYKSELNTRSNLCRESDNRPKRLHVVPKRLVDAQPGQSWTNHSGGSQPSASCD